MSQPAGHAMFDIVYQLKQRRDALSPVERRIADAILGDVDRAAQSGIAELAAEAKVSVAAISRFAKVVGCGNVRELRARLAEASAVGALEKANILAEAEANAEKAEANADKKLADAIALIVSRAADLTESQLAMLASVLTSAEESAEA